MSKQANQKLKLLYLKDYLERETDQEHPTSVKRIIEYLASIGIACERKTVYSDIEELRKYGLDIVSIKGSSPGYFIGERNFQLTELQLLTDAVSTSRFLTEKKTEELIAKLMELCSVHERAWLRNRIYDVNSFKSPNEHIYHTMFSLHQAAFKGVLITFKYWTYNIRKQREYKNGGRPYTVAPYLIIYSDGNYYLVAKDIDADKLKTFRVDKIDKVDETGTKDEDYPADSILAGFIKEQFSMFDGEAVNVTLSFDKTLIGVMVDKFGKQVPVTTRMDGTASLTVKVRTSIWFYSWLAGLGRQVKIEAPAKVREEYLACLQDIIDSYSTYSV